VTVPPLCFGLFWQIAKNLIEPIYNFRPQKERFWHFSKGRVLPPKTPKNSQFWRFWPLRRDPRDFLTTCCCMLRILYAYKFYQLRYLHLMIVVTSSCITQKTMFFMCRPRAPFWRPPVQASRILDASYEFVCIATLCYRHTACLVYYTKFVKLCAFGNYGVRWFGLIE